MFSSFLIVISYGALLLLLMQNTGLSAILTAAAFAIGVFIIAYRKAHVVALRKNLKFFLILDVVPFAVTFAISFYDRWLHFAGIQAIAAVLSMPVDTMLKVAALLLSLFSVYFLYAALRFGVEKLSHFLPRYDFVVSLLFCGIASVLTVVLAQTMLDLDVFSMGWVKFMWGVLTVWAATLSLFCLLGKMIPAILFGSGSFMVIATIDVYVYSFRARLFEPVDIFSVGTAMNVAEEFSLLPIPLKILTGWGFFLFVPHMLSCLRHKSKEKLSAKKRFVLLVVCLLSSAAVCVYATNLKTHHWHKDGALFNGAVLDFVSKFKEISAPKPDNYSTDLIQKLADQYAAAPQDGSETQLPKPPHIIVVMDEAFSDLSVVGKFATNMEVMPFISSLKENTISGYALTSVYGGNTANSEYEFLTGNSLAWLSPNVVPYQQYMRSSTYSMVSHLKSVYNYQCVAMHPYQSSGWNRPTAYERLGFDECYFIEDFPRRNYIRRYISDREMFELLIETFEAKKENPLFLFGVTMQNHSPYTYEGERYTQYISLDDFGDEYPEVEQYLSLLHETDRAVEDLIGYFQNIEEEVVIVFFGDHQPRIDEAFYKAVSGTTADTLDEQQKQYKVPFFIWTNYDTEENYIDCTSLSYLSTYVYDAAGIALPPYNQFLYELEAVIPSINANGFYSPSAGCYLPFHEAGGEERRWLELYEALQYNSIFDTKHRSETFFAALE